MSSESELQEMERELEEMQASECRRAAAREQEHQRQLRALRRKTVAVCLLAALVILGIIGALAISLASVPPGTDAAVVLDTGMATAEGDAPPESFTTDNLDGGVIERDMPKTPFPGQKGPPCKQRTQVELGGKCWIPSAIKPPCEDLFEHKGVCYVPVMAAVKPPTSIEP